MSCSMNLNFYMKRTLLYLLVLYLPLIGSPPMPVSLQSPLHLCIHFLLHDLHLPFNLFLTLPSSHPLYSLLHLFHQPLCHTLIHLYPYLHLHFYHHPLLSHVKYLLQNLPYYLRILHLSLIQPHSPLYQPTLIP